MGFTISNYSLFGLQPQNFYVSILGSYTIKKNHPVLGYYTITYTVYYSSSKGQEILMRKEQYFGLEQLPEPANIYTAIYDNIKQQLNTEVNSTITDD
jgi:hypothetical protein